MSEHERINRMGHAAMDRYKKEIYASRLVAAVRALERAAEFCDESNEFATMTLLVEMKGLYASTIEVSPAVEQAQAFIDELNDQNDGPFFDFAEPLDAGMPEHAAMKQVR